jgi:large subunit ribosomal protein L14
MPKSKRLTIGAVLTVVVKKRIIKRFIKKSKEIKKGQVCSALVVRSKTTTKRKWGNFFILTGSNSVVLINKSYLPLGSRIVGPIYRELRSVSRLSKVFTLAQVTL